MTLQRYLIVLNPAAGHARRGPVDRIIAALKAAGRTVDVYETRGPGDAITAVAGQAGGYDVVVAAGGDGTVNEVLNGLAGHPAVVLGLIPCGTTNVLATELGLPRRAAAIARVLIEGRQQPVYSGRANQRRFGMMVGLGYDAWVVAGVDVALKKKIGKLAYVLSMFRELRQFGTRRYRLELDGVVHEAGSAVLTLGRHYAGSYILAPRADLRRPDMEVVLVQTASRWAFLLMLLLLPLGLAARLPFMQTLSARQVRLSRADGVPEVLQADGDIAGHLPATITLDSQPLTVLVP